MKEREILSPPEKIFKAQLKILLELLIAASLSGIKASPSVDFFCRFLPSKELEKEFLSYLKSNLERKLPILLPLSMRERLFPCPPQKTTISPLFLFS